MNKKKCNLVLVGHGLKTSFIMGSVEQILKTYDIKTIIGGSMGSLIGLYVANGKFDILKEHWEDIEFLKSIFAEPYQNNIFSVFFKRNNLYKLNKLKKMIKKDIDFKNWKSDFFVTWTDYHTNQKNELQISNSKINKNLLINHILASITIPQIYPLLKISNHKFPVYGCNSCYSEYVPIATLIEENSDETIFIVSSSKYQILLPDKRKRLSENVLNLFVEIDDMFFNNNFNINIKKDSLLFWKKNQNDKIKLISPEFHIMQGLLEFNDYKIKHNIDYGKNVTITTVNSFI